MLYSFLSNLLVILSLDEFALRKEVHYIPLLKTNQNFIGELWYCVYAIWALLTNSFAETLCTVPHLCKEFQVSALRTLNRRSAMWQSFSTTKVPSACEP